MVEQIKMPTMQTKKRKRYFYVLIFIAAALIVWAWQGIYLAKGGSESAQVFVIEKGEDLVDISDNLKEAGLIKSKYLFQIYTLLRAKQNRLIAGGYDLSSIMNMPQILDTIVNGQTAKVNLTIIEGWNLGDIAWWFENQGMFQAEELLEVAGFPAVDHGQATDLPLPQDFSEEFAFLETKPVFVSLEGYLFPDTYQIGKGERPVQIIEKILTNFAKKISSELEVKIKSQGRTLFQVLTMASLLEKEVQTKQDKEIVAGILWKRLSNNWKLQVDATVTYLVGKTSLTLTKEDLDTDSPYNTYKYYGLPLGPIANPGLASIEAAVYYKASAYWFYLTTPEGETIFSRTLEEHNTNRAIYLK